MTKRVRFTPLLQAGLFATASFLAPRSATAREIPFQTQSAIAFDGFSPDPAVGDIDRDGDVDVAIADFGRLRWYENLGSGAAWTEHTISTTAGVGSLDAADIDGDGDLDLLAASPSDDRVAWYENPANPGSIWTVHAIFTSTNSAPEEVVAADVDGDGDLDALSASPNDDRIRWFENVSGQGLTWVAREITTVAFGAIAVFAGDVDGDGDTDVLSASFNDDTVAWYENTAGNGTSWTRRTISTAVDFARSVSAADLDRDGDLDAVAGAFLGASVLWFENTAGNGASWTARTIASNVGSAYPVVSADLDGDGDVDVMSISLTTLEWYENASGNGSTWTRRTIESFSSFRSAIPADIDGDGDLDVVSSSLDPGLTWHRNETLHESACFAARATVATGQDGAYAVHAADVDRDGDQDLLSASRFDDRIAWSENAAGDGSAWVLHTVSTASDGPVSVWSADVDGDGDPDVLSSSIYDWVVAWHENAGAGTWTTHALSTAAFGPASVIAADVDGDGDPDVLTASFVDAMLAWHVNPASGALPWALMPIFTLATGAVVDAQAADVDRDGDLDALSVSTLGVAWHENLAGNGTAWARRTISTVAGTTLESVSSEDIDGDGDLDVLSSGNGLFWYENVAAGATWVTRTIVTLGPAFSAEAHDVDRDGDVDVVASIGLGSQAGVHWFENVAGDGGTWVSHAQAVPDTRASVAADLDGDGDLDLAAASWTDDTISWFRNDAGQVVLDATDTAPSGAMNAELVPMLRIVVSHGGRARDGDLELARLGMLFEEAAGDPLTSVEANALVESLRVYRDVDGNGVFNPGADVMVASVPTLALTGGVQLVAFPDEDPGVRVAFGSPRTFFVVLELTSTASTQSPNRIRVTHLGAGPSASAAEDRAHDIPLRTSCPANVASGVVGPVTPVELMDFRIE